jgi:hypothetical protein
LILVRPFSAPAADPAPPAPSTAAR